MSANGAVWGRVRSRLRAFPERLAACGAEAAAYGRCVQASTAPGGRLSKDVCAREFEALRSCFAAAEGRGPVKALAPARVGTVAQGRPAPGDRSARSTEGRTAVSLRRLVHKESWSVLARDLVCH
ncbi:hypothetical protein SUZIE_214530 [Sciurus carolinensis]|uniref:NADH dehydrogenase [ubiquinone] 1 alpha subcomplex assembly factor 8 n=1 Tax=Sciurus carolinensis TaxID=30640 RepID=A0AA41NJU6_SCICA|nr:hypothetical protein [Sciurus carolinensis]